jgi:type IV pilus biogenesis protein CpaD/CtpE
MVMTPMELSISFTMPEPCSQVFHKAARARHPTLTKSPAPSHHGVLVVAGDGRVVVSEKTGLKGLVDLQTASKKTLLVVQRDQGREREGERAGRLCD